MGEPCRQFLSRFDLIRMPPSEPASSDMPIVEGIMTSLNEDGAPNIAPMGPRVDRDFRQFILRPYVTSTTYKNLKRTGEGVFHVVDDVDLLARAAVGALATLPPMTPAARIRGFVLSGACRWYELRVDSLDDASERTTIRCCVEHFGTLRESFGFNRAKHAVLEAAILATRISILPASEIKSELARLAIPVEKTAGIQEQEAFDFLRRHVEEQLSRRD
jgi:hypothetical protein